MLFRQRLLKRQELSKGFIVGSLIVGFLRAISAWWCLVHIALLTVQLFWQGRRHQLVYFRGLGALVFLGARGLRAFPHNG
jgi:hypothetical protein